MADTIALIAHDSQKDNIVQFASQHAPVLSRYRLIATGTTGQRVQDATSLTIDKMLSGPLGGDTQIAAEVSQGNVVAVFFLVDPLYAQPHEPDIQALLRICNVHNVSLATNLATAEAIATKLSRTQVAHLIFNPVAGQGNSEQELNLIKQLLEPHYHLKICQTTEDIDSAQLAKDAIAAGADIIIASGGDGTVSSVAGELISTGIPLGVIPRGTANAFSVALGIPQLLPIRNACQVILAGNTRTVDVARCNGMPMILLAGVGYEAETVERASRDLKDRWGAMAYLMAGWQMLDEQGTFDAVLEAEGQTYELQANAITIANAAPPTSVLAQGAGEVIMDDGLLDVTIATVETKVQAVTTMLRMLGAALVKAGGISPQDNSVVHGRAKRIKVTTEPPQKVVVDGEIIGTTPIDVECIPDGLTVLVPAAS